MEKYIRVTEAAELAASLCKIPLADLVDRFADISAADVAPVRHGRWVEVESTQGKKSGEKISWYSCSACRHLIVEFERDERPAYCDECGAKMDLEGEK